MGRQVWHNYWDIYIRSEASFWTHFNYTHNNPLKHGYVSHPGEWEFSRFGDCLDGVGYGVEFMTVLMATSLSVYHNT